MLPFVGNTILTHQYSRLLPFLSLTINFHDNITGRFAHLFGICSLLLYYGKVKYSNDKKKKKKMDLSQFPYDCDRKWNDTEFVTLAPCKYDKRIIVISRSYWARSAGFGPAYRL